MACLIVRTFWHDSLPVLSFLAQHAGYHSYISGKVMVFGKIDYNFMFDGQ